MTMLLLTLTAMSISISVEGGDNNNVYSPCKDTTVQRHDGFTFGIAFSSKNSFFLNNDSKNTSLQLSPCDKRLSLSNAQLALFRPKVDEISLLTINTSSFSPVIYLPPANLGFQFLIFLICKFDLLSLDLFDAVTEVEN